jgi:hypothetical protein
MLNFSCSSVLFETIGVLKVVWPWVVFVGEILQRLLRVLAIMFQISLAPEASVAKLTAQPLCM